MAMSKFLKISCTILFVPGILLVSFLWADGDKHEKKMAQSKKMHWTAPADAQNRLNPVTDPIESAVRGKGLYQANCMDCHGSKADGNGPAAEYMVPRPSNLRVMAGHHPDGGMAWKIETGKGSMPAWKDEFTEQQIWDLVNFIQSLKKKN